MFKPSSCYTFQGNMGTDDPSDWKSPHCDGALLFIAMQLVFNNDEDSNSHDPTLLHHVIKFHLLLLF